jgi:hypothetical protein
VIEARGTDIHPAAVTDGVVCFTLHPSPVAAKLNKGWYYSVAV